MKKIVTLFMVVVLMLSVMVFTAYAEDEIKVFVENSRLEFDVAPETTPSFRTMVPMRAIFEALGCTVSWDEASLTAKGVTSESKKTVELTIGSSIMKVNGANVVLDAAPYQTKDRTLVPVRAISESLDCEVHWDEDTQTVSIFKKLIPTGNVTYDGSANGYPRILITGNSITRHAPSTSLGWNGNYGMAASSESNDFVHILIKKVREIHPNAVFCIVQAAQWERGYNDEGIYNNYATAPDFRPDVVIYRLGENVKDEYLAQNDLLPAINSYLRFLTSKSEDVKYVFTTNFWKDEAVDNATRAAAQAKGVEAIEIGHLGDDDMYKAKGLFSHSGVANHPGDAGMQAIADAIWTQLEGIVRAIPAK
ncbi:MAG: copper amine oxidase N-terminal domain-containing protein [Clostridia bacterium]|nr:copper amine oxidase N-terminal domain-containing protein [Clostridia bacterium]